MTTTTLNNGLTVLAKDTKYGVMAKTYANETQANAAAEKIRSEGTSCDVIGRRPYFVVIR